MLKVAAIIMFVNGMAFLVRIYIHVKFTMVKYLEKRTTGNIYKYLGKINDVYYRRGMYVGKISMGRNFENTRTIVPGISTLNTTAADEHIIEIERQIRVIK